jgi:5'-deoxynucleotidase YfbR-like HD superfamily hydrolase
MNVASLVPPKYKLAALLHDAAEAYIGDVPTPLKELLGSSYRDVENRLAKAIAAHFNLKMHSLVHLPSVVKEADRLMLISEHHILQANPANWIWDADQLRLSCLPYEGCTISEFKEAVRAAQEHHK